MQYISGFSLFQMKLHLATTELNILQINYSLHTHKYWRTFRVSGWPQLNTNHSLLSGTLESRTSFTLNGKCTLPSCGQNINNTEICWRLRNCSAYYSEQLSCPGFPNALMMTSPCSVELWSWVISVNKIRCNATWRNGSLLKKLWNTNARDLGSWLWLLLVSIFPTVKWLLSPHTGHPGFWVKLTELGLHSVLWSWMF